MATDFQFRMAIYTVRTEIALSKNSEEVETESPDKT